MSGGGFVFFVVLLGLVVVAIAVIDLRTQRIPDALNLTLLAGGLGFHASNVDLVLRQIAFGAAVFSLFLVVRKMHSAFTGFVGLGLGDVKMAGAGAMWFSAPLFPLFLFAASFCALGFVLVLATIDRSISRHRRIPFGPFLGLGIAIAFCAENFG